MSNLERVHHGLRACKGNAGLFDPMMAFDCLNKVQKETDPNIYEPEIAKNLKAMRKRENIERQKMEELKNRIE